MFRLLHLLVAGLVCCNSFAQSPAPSASVPFQTDHERIIIKATVASGDGTSANVNVWVDNGNPTMSITASLVAALHLPISADSSGRAWVTGSMGLTLIIGKMKIPVKDLPIEVEQAPTVGTGVDAAISISSTLLRNYDVIVDYTQRRLILGTPGSLHFEGSRVDVFVHPQNALIQIPARVDDDTFHVALDLGTPVSLIAADLVSKWNNKHPSWPAMRGAVGVANLWGLDSEPQWRLLRVSHLSYSGIDLQDLVVATCPPDWLDYFIARVGMPTAGLIGEQALQHFRIGIDYTHQCVYFQKMAAQPDTGFDVIGLTLRPGEDGSYRILGVAEENGKPAVEGVRRDDLLVAVDNHRVTHLTMGEVWSLLSGPPGAIRTLTLNRGGKTVTIKARIHKFLAVISTPPAAS